MRTLVFLLLTGGLALAADISGKWVFQVETSGGSGSPTFIIKQDGEKLSGSYSGALGEAKIRGSVKGEEVTIEFDAEGGGQSAVITYKGKIESPKKMSGTVKMATFAAGTWTGTKQE
ncbi:MAG: hypothetical protein FJW20_15360 [Acidimicrobiia bacterium]|nr:hypothetical protein [Acidimicrobiia bacterium]